MLKHESSSSCNSLEVDVPKPSAHRWGVTPPVLHLCEHLLSWKSCSCIPQKRCWWQGWHWDRQRGAAGRAALTAQECEVPPWAAGCLWAGSALLLQSQCNAAQPVHCPALHVTGEQAVWHEAALWPLVWPVRKRWAGAKQDVGMDGPVVRSL